MPSALGSCLRHALSDLRAAATTDMWPRSHCARWCLPLVPWGAVCGCVPPATSCGASQEFPFPLPFTLHRFAALRRLCRMRWASPSLSISFWSPSPRRVDGWDLVAWFIMILFFSWCFSLDLSCFLFLYTYAPRLYARLASSEASCHPLPPFPSPPDLIRWHWFAWHPLLSQMDLIRATWVWFVCVRFTLLPLFLAERCGPRFWVFVHSVGRWPLSPASLSVWRRATFF
jgi:hypothetical protein